MLAGALRRAVVTLLVLALAPAAAALANAPAAHRLPRGAVRVTDRDYRSVDEIVRCGRVHHRWVPASREQRRWFVTDTQRAHNFVVHAQRSSGALRRLYVSRSRFYRRRAARFQRACAPVRFRLSGARGLALHRTPSFHDGDLSNLDVVTRHGRLRDAVTSGAADVAHLYTAPSGKVYALFRTPIEIPAPDQSGSGSSTSCDDGSGDPADSSDSSGDSSDSSGDSSADDPSADSTSADDGSGDDTSSDDGTGDSSGCSDGPAATYCLLAELDPATQTPTCVDPGLTSVRTWANPGSNDAVQFDAKGAIYYLGTSTGQTVLRRYLDGTTTDYLSSSDVLVDDFAVLGDGDVLISGATLPTGARWVRRVGPDKVVHTLRASAALWMRVFPDGNAYLGMFSPGDYGIRRFTASSNTVEPKYWLTGPINGQTADAEFTTNDVCGGADDTLRAAFCDQLGSRVTAVATTTTGRVYAVAGTKDVARLVQLYPQVAVPASTLSQVSVAEPMGDDLALAGVDADDHPVLVVHNTATDEETTLIGPDAELEVYHLSYDAKGGRLLFDGLRFADDKYVLGAVDLATHAVTIDATGAKSWTDVQAVGAR